MKYVPKNVYLTKNGKWIGKKMIKGVKYCTTFFDNAKDAAFAIDTIMRKHGLDESRTNFPKVAVSRSKSAKSKKTKLACK